MPGCAEGEAPCQEGGHCVPHGWLCDHQDDCGDGSDEEGERPGWQWPSGGLVLESVTEACILGRLPKLPLLLPATATCGQGCSGFWVWGLLWDPLSASSACLPSPHQAVPPQAVGRGRCLVAPATACPWP